MKKLRTYESFNSEEEMEWEENEDIQKGKNYRISKEKWHTFSSILKEFGFRWAGGNEISTNWYDNRFKDNPYVNIHIYQHMIEGGNVAWTLKDLSNSYIKYESFEPEMEWEEEDMNSKTYVVKKSQWPEFEKKLKKEGFRHLNLDYDDPFFIKHIKENDIIYVRTGINNIFLFTRNLNGIDNNTIEIYNESFEPEMEWEEEDDKYVLFKFKGLSDTYYISEGIINKNEMMLYKGFKWRTKDIMQHVKQISENEIEQILNDNIYINVLSSRDCLYSELPIHISESLGFNIQNIRKL